ncbi:MAG: glycosyltransferase [Acidobacteria bacterium]|nr:glycosyltransferase [Acidobacteriota bacterium]
MPPVILVFAKAPVPGRVKTRLQPVLSPEECAELHRSFVGDVLEGLQGFNGEVDLELHLDQAFDDWREFDVPRELQSGGDLGERMWNAAQNAFSKGRTQVMILGSDAPTLPIEHLKQLLDSSADVAFGPTEDGGYYAVMFRRLKPAVFDGVEWSTESTLEQSMTGVRKAGLSAELGPGWYDIDSPADLVRLVVETTPPRTRAWLKANHFLVDPPADSI